MTEKKDEIEFSNKEIMDLFRQFIEYLKTENPEQRRQQLINKGIDALIVLVILIGTAYLGSITVLEGQMVAGIYGTALGYILGIGRR